MDTKHDQCFDLMMEMLTSMVVQQGDRFDQMDDRIDRMDECLDLIADSLLGKTNI